MNPPETNTGVSEDPKVLFGRRLRELRTQKNWSQEYLAFEAGLDRTYIGGIENGKRNVSLVNICRLAKALDVTPSELVDFTSGGRRGPAAGIAIMGNQTPGTEESNESGRSLQ